MGVWHFYVNNKCVNVIFNYISIVLSLDIALQMCNAFYKPLTKISIRK